MLDEAQVLEIAREADAAQRAAGTIAPFTDRVPGFDLASAYAAARRIHAWRLERGMRPAGRKIGFSYPELWKIYGVREPIWGWMYDTTVRPVGAALARCALAGLVEPKIEPEIVFRFRSAPSVGGDLAALVDSIDWVAHGFEIVQSHYPGWKFRAPDTVVDGSLHGTLLVGEPRPFASLAPDPVAALESFTLELHRDDALRESGRGSNVLGSPLVALAHLLGILSRQPEEPAIEAGEIVTTGTITTAHAVRAGETWRTRIAGLALPGLAVQFVA